MFMPGNGTQTTLSKIKARRSEAAAQPLLLLPSRSFARFSTFFFFSFVPSFLFSAFVAAELIQ